MAILTRHSVIGVVCGVLCTLLLETAAAALFMNSFSSEDGDSPSMEASFMPLSVRLGDLEGGVVDMYGQKIRFADLRGKVVVLNLWATWCPPCRAEMPSLDNLWKAFQGNADIAVICASEEAAEDVRAHPVSRTVTMPLYVFASETPKELDAPALPTTFIFDRAGRMIFEHAGMAQWDAPEVVEFLNSQLAAQRERRE